MLPDFQYIALFYLHFSIAAAQLLSEVQSFRDDPNSILRCWGDLDNYRDVVEAPAGVTLAQACRASRAFMECGYQRDSQRPYYGNVGWNQVSPRLPVHILLEPWNSDIEFTKLHPLLMQICSIKCACVGQDPTEPISRYNSMPANTTYVYKIDDNTIYPDADERMMASKSNAQYLYGVNLAFNPFRMPQGRITRYRDLEPRLDVFYRPPTDTTSGISSIAFVGYKPNQPICQTDGDFSDQMPQDLVAAVVKGNGGNQKLNANELCSHQFFGGSSKGNLGAVCRRAQGEATGPRTFAIDGYRKAPQYTNDYYPPRLFNLVAVDMLEAYCYAACHCPEEDEAEVKARGDAYLKLVSQIKDPNTGIHLEVEEEAPILAQGGGNTTTAPIQETFDIEAPPNQNAPGCSQNSGCGSGSVCVVKLEETLNHLVQWAGTFILGCVARKAINPNSRDLDP